MIYPLAKPYSVSYLRKSFNSSNPNTDGLISITASSTFADNSGYRSDISCLIRENDYKRWHSDSVKGSNFTIDFHSNKVFLKSYEISTHANFRFIVSWDLYGIRENKKILIDRVQNHNKIAIKEGTCYSLNNTTVSFTCKYPGKFSRFLMINTDRDSCGDDVLSLSRLMFYGSINMNISSFSQTSESFLFSLSCLIFLVCA